VEAVENSLWGAAPVWVRSTTSIWRRTTPRLACSSSRSGGRHTASAWEGEPPPVLPPAVIEQTSTSMPFRSVYFDNGFFFFFFFTFTSLYLLYITVLYILYILYIYIYIYIYFNYFLFLSPCAEHSIGRLSPLKTGICCPRIQRCRGSFKKHLSLRYALQWYYT
jgi:hypothetical protein